MTDAVRDPIALTRRHFLHDCSVGLGAIAASALLAEDVLAFTVSGTDGLLEEAGDEIGNLRVDVGVNALLLDTL